jgi:putative (di)nucleoside polyphosphate hydrolase
MNAPHPSSDLRPYRFNVGIALFNSQGLVWLGRAISDGPEYVLADYEWQMPQGGIAPDEDLIAAARRELQEETGIVAVTPLGSTETWWHYDFPPKIGAPEPHKLDAFRGQQQRWVALRFTGDEADIRLDGEGLDFKPEFSAWRWASLDEAVACVMPYKKPVYRKMAEAFRRFTIVA